MHNEVWFLIHFFIIKSLLRCLNNATIKFMFLFRGPHLFLNLSPNLYLNYFTIFVKTFKKAPSLEAIDKTSDSTIKLSGAHLNVFAFLFYLLFYML